MSRVPRRLAIIVAIVATGIALTAGPAAALGNNRVVYRSCGSNWVASGGGDGYYWADTIRNSGDCSGRLSAGLQYYNGQRTPRVYGDREGAYTDVWNPGLAVQYGLHWGCDSCNVTYS